MKTSRSNAISSSKSELFTNQMKVKQMDATCGLHLKLKVFPSALSSNVISTKRIVLCDTDHVYQERICNRSLLKSCCFNPMRILSTL